MKVLHIGLLSHFTDKMLYQDNILSELNAREGHDVTYISDTFMYINGRLAETEECDIVLDNGVRLIRIKFDKIINSFVSRKIQKSKAIVNYLKEIQPDTILYHGVCGYELMDVANYVKEKHIPFYIDSHENFKNTAMTPISRLAYKFIHGYFVNRALPFCKKILYVGYPEKEYLKKMYDIPDSKLEYFPLGGLLLDKEKQSFYRKSVISKYSFPQNALICTHSGKIDKGKKTEEIIKAFKMVKDDRLRLIIYGSISDDIRSTIEQLINSDDRILFLGWKSPKEQEELLGATDLYIQPGSYSATAQIALCNGCALIVNDDYKKSMGDSVFYEENAKGIVEVLNMFLSDIDKLDNVKRKCFELASNTFDYKKMADRYLL